MCSPALAIAGAGLVFSGVQAYNQNQQGKATAAALTQQAGIDRQAATDARAQGDRDTERLLWRTRQALGTQRAATAANGIEVTGTPAEILGETALFGEIEQQDARLNAARAAWGYDVSADQNLTGARNARRQGRSQAGSTILGGLMNFGTAAAANYGGGGNAIGSTRGTTYKAPTSVKSFRK